MIRLSDPGDVAAGVRDGNVRAIARAISWVEDEDRRAGPLLSAIYEATGRARTVGVTGPPGAGKSTLVDRLAAHAAGLGRRVAIVAVDPASPFTGGAILGDRVRMALNKNTYFRSMSTRGHLGGLALATEAAVNVLDAAGFDLVLIETVGVGQSEIEVAQLADTTVLVQPPGLGDGVQAVKAGIMEIPGLFVINKADLPGAKQAAEEIRQYLALVEPAPQAWRAPVLLISATQSAESEVEALWAALDAHWAYLGAQGRLEASREARARALLWREAERLLSARLRSESGDVEHLVTQVAGRHTPPWEAAQALVRAWRP